MGCCAVSGEQGTVEGYASVATARRIHVLPPLNIVRVSQVEGPRKIFHQMESPPWVYSRRPQLCPLKDKNEDYL